jgi:AraC-like DNA-binding protein
VDSIAGLLDGPRARSAFVLRSVLDPPWSIRIEDEAPLTVLSMVRGGAWVIAGHDGPVRLGTGDVAVFRGPRPYTVADDPGTPPQAVIHPGQRCTTPDGEPLTELHDLGVRTWGNARDGGTVLLTGTYQTPTELSGRLLRALPDLVVLPAGSWDNPLVGLLAAEAVRDRPGQEAVLDRLLDLLLIAALRSWFDRPGGQAPGWYRADADPVVGPVLQLIHHHPAEPWTVASLAAQAGVSRAALARRFHGLVGQPPMAFLTEWRLALAADLLAEGGTVDAVARAVGYGSSFALSTAFKRVRGVSPSEHRATVLGVSVLA